MIEENIYVHTETQDFKGTIQEAGGFIFIHLDVKTWSPSVFRELKVLFTKVLEEFSSKGHELIFTTTNNPQTLKFCELICPLYEKRELDHYGEKYWVVAWETGLET